MKRHPVALMTLCAALLVVIGAELGYLGAQPARGSFPAQLRGAPVEQNSLKVDNSTTPNRVDVGCEKDQEGGGSQPVNGLRLFGAVAGSGPTLQTIPCTGGDANIPLTIAATGTPASPLAVNGDTSDVFLFLAANEACVSDNAALIPTRLALGDWARARTAAGAETFNISCWFPTYYRTATGKGAKLTSFAIAQQITVVALTSNTFNGLRTVTYANNVANLVSTYGGTITITPPTATQANPYLTEATIGTPAYMNLANSTVAVDFTVVMANTGVYRLYGVQARYSTQLY